MKNRSQVGLDAKDLLVVLEMAFGATEGRWTHDRLAKLLGMSTSQVHASVKRLVMSKLLLGDGLRGQVNRRGLQEFIIHGAKWVFPPVFGKPTRGIPTGASSDFFRSSLIPSNDLEDNWVWPDPHGESRGVSLEPIYPSVLHAIRMEPRLYEALVHFDALRAGRARERAAAEQFFQEELT